MKGYRDNLLAQFSVVSLVIMVILALIVSFVFIELLERAEDSDPMDLRRQLDNLRWITLGAIGGSFVYLYATLVFMVWGGSRTITRQRVELQSANAELEQRVAELAAIQSSMAEGLMVLDPAGNVMYSNETAKPLLGLATDEVHGKHIGEILGRVASEFEPSNGMKALLDLAQSPGDSPSTVALTLERPQRRHLEVTSFHIPARDDRTMMGLLARDVTQEKELQDRRDSFVSIASHEFRTPMTTIMGFSELLLNNTDVPDSTRNDWLERIYQNSKVLASIVDNMLSVTRIQSGRLVVNIESVRLSKVVDDVLASIEPDTHEAHSFEASVPQDIPDVMVDREKLTQVLINLVTNAVKYSPQGGRVTVSARTEAERGRVVVAVADEGIGVAPEDQERLFESFHRISRPETEGIRGTGLSVVKGLVELMGGDVWVESELGKGSSFFFTVSTKGSDVQQARDKGKSPAT